MASIVDLVRPKAAFDPKLLPYSQRPSMRPGTGCSSREANAPGQPMRVPCARSSRGASLIWRNGA